MKKTYILLIIAGVIRMFLGGNLNHSFVAEAQAPWYGLMFWNSPYNWSEYSYGYQSISAWFPTTNTFVPSPSQWVIDPGYFPPGLGPNSPGTTGYGRSIYQPPGPIPSGLPPGWGYNGASIVPLELLNKPSPPSDEPDRPHLEPGKIYGWSLGPESEWITPNNYGFALQPNPYLLFKSYLQ
jgi:hypothetical protein